MNYQNYENHLFRDGYLDQYLRERMEELQTEVKQLNIAGLSDSDEETEVKKLLQKYSLQTPILGEVKKVDAQETDIEVPSMLHDDETYTAKGLYVSVEVPFTGDAELFQLRASTYSGSGVPTAMVHSDKLILTYQTTEKDPEKIKQLWPNTLAEINKHLEWTKKDVLTFNQHLTEEVSKLVVERARESGNNQSIIDQIKLG